MEKAQARCIAINDIRQKNLVANAAIAILTRKSSSSNMLLPLQRQLNKDDAVIRSSAIKSISEIGGSEAIAMIARHTNDNSPDVRIQACLALGKMRAHTAKTQLYDTLEDPEPAVRCAAAKALGIMGDKSGFTHVVSLIKKRGKYRFQALRALNSITYRRYPINDFGVKSAISWLKTVGNNYLRS